MPPKASNHRGAGGGCPQRPPTTGGQEGMQSMSPRMLPKASNHGEQEGDATDEPEGAPKGFQPQRGRTGCSQ